MLGKIVESDYKDPFGNVRTARLICSQRGFAQDVYRLAETGRAVIRQPLDEKSSLVRWLTADKWSGGYEPSNYLKDGLMIDVVDESGAVVFTENTWHSEWNGGGLAEKAGAFSWEDE